MPENQDLRAPVPVPAVAGRVPAPRGGNQVAVPDADMTMADAFMALLSNSEGLEDDVSDDAAYFLAEAAGRRPPLLAETGYGDGSMQELPAPDAARQVENPVAVADGTQVAWGRIFDLPTYQVNAIRGQGREIFRSLPCYAALERELAPKGRDALGELQMLANVGGGGPHPQGEIDRVARWIRDNGRPVDARTLNLPRIPGYAPRIILACDEERSFLLVSEPAFKGMQQGSTYIYGWSGGMRFYRERPAAGDALGAVMVNRLPPPGVGAPPVAALPAPQGNRTAVPADAAPRRARQRPAPAAPASPSSLAAAFMDIGFSKHGTAAGPELTRATEGGGSATLVSAEDGVPLHKAGSLRLVVRDEAGDLVGEALVGSVDELDVAMAPAGPRP